MSKVKWIKIYTDMLSNKKIKSIRKMPEGNNIVLIWVLLIAQAGECNKSGALYLTDTIPFTIDELAIQFEYEKSILSLALMVLEKYEMIEIFDEIIYIKNWEKYQNEKGLEKLKEQTRLRVARHRENKKLLCNVTVTLPVTECNTNVTQQNKNKNKNKNKIENNISLTPKSKFDEENFNTFWDLYPRKKEITRAQKAFAKLKKSEIPLLLLATQNYANEINRTKRDLQYVVYPSKFIKECYTDYLSEQTELSLIDTTGGMTRTKEGGFQI